MKGEYNEYSASRSNPLENMDCFVKYNPRGIFEEANKLLKAKTEALQSAKRTEELFAEAIAAFRSYSGSGGDEDEEEF